MVLQNLIRAASAVGLGACPISVIRNHATRIAELLARQVSVPERQDFGAFVRRQGFKLD